MGPDALDPRVAAIVALGHAIREHGYTFTTVSPETHRRVDARAATRGRLEAHSLRDVFGWSRPFEEALLAPRILELAKAADVIEEDGPLLRAKVRFSSIGADLFVHSAYPTLAADAVFFGPDTYRFCQLVDEQRVRASRVIDVGCGSGAGGLVAAKYAERVVLADVNRTAVVFAQVNAALAGVTAKVTTIESDVLAGVRSSFDLVVANPPYMIDPSDRAYRNGGGMYGEALAVRIAREALTRLERGGRLVLYTGAAVVGGVDTFLEAVRGVCVDAGAKWHYREIDPDVFGEEITSNEAYARVERIAAVALVATAC